MPFKTTLKIVLWIFLSLFITLLIIFINLPNILESQIKNQIAKRVSNYLNPEDIEFNIQNSGLFNTHVSKISIFDSISIDSINFDYNIRDLPSINIEKVTISGLNIHASLNESNQIKIKGIDFPDNSQEQPGKKNLAFLHYLPGKIIVENSKIILHLPNNASDDKFLIPFDITSFTNVQDNKIDAEVKFYPFGETINGFISYDISKNIKSVLIQGLSFDVGHLNNFISKKTDKLQLKGLFDFNLESNSKKKWDLYISKIALIQPLKANIQDIKVNLLIDNRRIKATGFMQVSNPLLQTIGLEYAADIDLQNKNYLNLKLETKKIDTLRLLHKSNLVIVKQPELRALFKGTPENIKGEIIFNTHNINIQNNQGDIAVSDLNIVSKIVADFRKNGNGITSKFKFNTNNIVIHSDFMASSIPGTDILGEFFLNKENSPSCEMVIRVDDADISFLKYKTKASGINIELPVSFPQSGKKIYGKYSISSILYDKKYDFSTKGEILQTNSKSLKDKVNSILNTRFKIAGNIDFNILPDITTLFDSIINFDEKGLQASCDMQTNSFKFSESDFKKLKLSKIITPNFDVTAMAEARVDFADSKLTSFMNLSIKDGTIFMPDNDLTAAGINTNIQFNDLLSFTTAPGQVVTIDSIEKEKIKIKDAKIIFTMEDGKSLLIENIKFKWCNGLVSTESIRLPQINDKYSLSLYCDRLELTQLLKQMGAFDAQGSGTLNGRIPVIYSKGNVSFDNGFLFSTPGKGGKVIIENSDKIISGIPMDSPQFAQLDLASEALKDFKYKWAKLKFHTKKDTLFVNMELDGEPSKILPFVYSKEVGTFIRVDASSPGSHFQGIKLDINLQLPFNAVLKSGNKLKSIFN